MTDALKKLRAKQEERERQEAYNRVMNQAIADYAVSIERRDKFIDTLTFAISDPDALKSALREFKELLEVLNELIPAPIRTEYEARQASKNMDIVGGGVM